MKLNHFWYIKLFTSCFIWGTWNCIFAGFPWGHCLRKVAAEAMGSVCEHMTSPCPFTLATFMELWTPQACGADANGGTQFYINVPVSCVAGTGWPCCLLRPSTYWSTTVGWPAWRSPWLRSTETTKMTMAFSTWPMPHRRCSDAEIALHFKGLLL